METTTQELTLVDKFKLGRKWFWVGVIMAIASFLSGLIYGLFLIFEKDHRKEGMVILALTIIWWILFYSIIYPYLVEANIIMPWIKPSAFNLGTIEIMPIAPSTAP
jgi:hypothetical protein